MKRWFASVSAALALAGCALSAPVVPPAPVDAPTTESGVSLAGFLEVVSRTRPMAGAVCREASPHLDCDFIILVDDRPGQPANAFHMRDQRGRPIIGFTTAFITELENPDEIALVLGHEAGHHIADHIPRLQREAYAGAVMGGLVATLSGLDRASARELVQASAIMRSRRYSQEFEIEADRIGTLIAYRAGFDPWRGAGLLRRSPDPDNRYLATHPPNAERLRAIERTLARIKTAPKN